MKPKDFVANTLSGSAHYVSDLLSQRKQFIFMHIPKTAGTSLTRAIERAGLQRRIIRAGHWKRPTDLHPMGRNWCTFAVIRNPLAWYVSLYKSRFQIAYDDPNKTYHRMERNTWEDFFEDVILGSNGVDGFFRWQQQKPGVSMELAKYYDRDVGKLSIRYLFHCFPAWREILERDDAIQYALDNYHDLNGMDHTLRTEHLQDDFDKMLEAENEPLKLDLSVRANVTDSNPNVPKEKQKHFSEYYTGDMEKAVRERDRLIFETFGY